MSKLIRFVCVLLGNAPTIITYIVWFMEITRRDILSCRAHTFLCLHIYMHTYPLIWSLIRLVQQPCRAIELWIGGGLRPEGDELVPIIVVVLIDSDATPETIVDVWSSSEQHRCCFSSKSSAFHTRSILYVHSLGASDFHYHFCCRI